MYKYLTLAGVQKKSPWLHYEPRILRLFSDRIEYLEPKSMVIKGIIKLDNTCTVLLIDDYNFEINGNSRKFVFKVILL
jgi:hypothetical protein